MNIQPLRNQEVSRSRGQNEHQTKSPIPPSLTVSELSDCVSATKIELKAQADLLDATVRKMRKMEKALVQIAKSDSIFSDIAKEALL